MKTSKRFVVRVITGNKLVNVLFVCLAPLYTLSTYKFLISHKESFILFTILFLKKFNFDFFFRNKIQHNTFLFQVYLIVARLKYKQKKIE